MIISFFLLIASCISFTIQWTFAQMTPKLVREDVSKITKKFYTTLINIFLGLGEEINTRGDYWSNGAWKLEGWRCRYHQYFQQLIDLTDYSLLPNGPVSMLTYFSMSGADKDYIPMFSWTNLFLAVLKLNNKVIFEPILSTKHE
jgi:hypothetical protein